MLFDKKLATFAAGLRTEYNIPMEVRLWNGQSYQLGRCPQGHGACAQGFWH